MADSCVPEPFARVPKGIYTAGLNLYATTLYGWLSAAYGGYKVIRPAVATLAADLGWSARTVKRVLRDLEEAGWLTITERPGTSSVYELARDSRAAAQNRRSLQGGVSGQSPVTAESPLGVSGRSPRGCPASHPIQLEETARETAKDRPIGGSPAAHPPTAGILPAGDEKPGITFEELFSDGNPGSKAGIT